MAISHTQTLVVANANVSLSGNFVENGGSEVVVDQSLSASVTNQHYTIAIVRANLQSLIIYADKATTLKTNGADAVQTLSKTGTVSGGTFTASFGGQTTAAIAYNADHATVQAALVALGSIGAGGVACTGGPLPATPVVCTFGGALAIAPQSTMTTGSGSLTGGGTIDCASTTTGVVPTDTFAIVAGTPLVWSASSAYFANPFTANVAQWSLTTGAQATRLQARVLTT